MVSNNLIPVFISLVSADEDGMSMDMGDPSSRPEFHPINPGSKHSIGY